MTDTTVTTEIELRAEVTRLRSALARISGRAETSAMLSDSTIERKMLVSIKEIADAALDGAD